VVRTAAPAGLAGWSATAGVAVAGGAGIRVWVEVTEAVGVSVCIGVLLGAAVAVSVGIGVSVGVAVNVSVGGAVCVAVGEEVEVSEGVAVAVDVGQAVAVAVGRAPGRDVTIVPPISESARHRQSSNPIFAFLALFLLIRPRRSATTVHPPHNLPSHEPCAMIDGMVGARQTGLVNAQALRRV